MITQNLLNRIKGFLPDRHAQIVDYGAGTGRLAIPLVLSGHWVTAVEPCIQMIETMQRKMCGRKVEAVCSKIQDFNAESRYDMALCIFTVISYILDEDSFDRSVRAISNSLKEGGRLFMDIPTIRLFDGFRFRVQNGRIDRDSGSTRVEGDLYTYWENTTIRMPDGSQASYSEEFPIRFWRRDFVTGKMAEHGLELEADLSGEFACVGSEYMVFRKTYRQG
jgi:SAM-dependent methyltransferase